MKLVLSKYILFWIAVLWMAFGQAQDLTEIRTKYPLAVKNKAEAETLMNELKSVSIDSDKVLLAYKASVMTLMAKFSKQKKEKKEFFKEGVSLMEAAVIASPDNIEIRCLRLGVQENSPKFLGYHKNKEEDKGFILNHYPEVSSKAVQIVIKDFVSQSKSFSEAEKLLFK